jgi:formiminotetrahydrofolate cyclodeaminase
MPELRQFLDELASGSPVPGGGSAAAVEAAMAAALVSMVTSLTLGRKRFESVHEEVTAIHAQADGLQARALNLVQEDSEAYQRVADVFSLPRGTEEEKALRRQRMQTALKGAVDPPLQTMQVAAEIAELCTRLVKIGNPSAVSDVGTAILSARSSYHAGRLNVEINLSSIDDAEWVADVRRRMGEIDNPDEAERIVMKRVMDTVSHG